MNSSLSINLGNHIIGGGHPAYVVAEMSANHGQKFERAVEIIKVAKEAGANAIKVQTYTPDTLTTDCRNECFQIGKGTIWEGKSLYQLYGEAYTPWDWQPKLKQIANDLGMDFFSTPFDLTALEFLEEMNVPAYKIASFEVVDIPLIRRIGETGKPIIMSTGMATREEIGEAVQAIRETGNDKIVLLKCTSAYPAPPEEMNLVTISDMESRFCVSVGLSDHTLGIAVPVAAVTLGACIVEKHITLSRSVPGPDSSFSLEPAEFKMMVEAIRVVERAKGKVNYELTRSEEASRIFRRSLFVVSDMKPGDIFSKDNVRSIRPGHGLPPKYQDEIIGRVAAHSIARGTPLSWYLIA